MQSVSDKRFEDIFNEIMRSKYREVGRPRSPITDTELYRINCEAFNEAVLKAQG